MKTQTVTWFPEGSNACLLTAAQVKPGRITESDWLDALADRVQAMVMAQENPQEAIAWAARQLSGAGAIMLPSGPARAAGQVLVRHNLENWVELAEMALHP